MTRRPSSVRALRLDISGLAAAGEAVAPVLDEPAAGVLYICGPKLHYLASDERLIANERERHSACVSSLNRSSGFWLSPVATQSSSTSTKIIGNH
jgi:hypothetical protein